MRRKELAIIGATGKVGRTLLAMIAKKPLFQSLTLRLFASEKSLGQSLEVGDQSYLIEPLSTYDCSSCALALFATSTAVSKQYIPFFRRAGSYVVDSSAQYRLAPDVPLIVPPVNLHLVNASRFLYAVANCLACPVSIVIKPLHDFMGVKRIQLSTYQSVSGAGKLSMDRLYEETRQVIHSATVEQEGIKTQYAFNVVPQIDSLLPDGFSYEEFKIINEVKKIVSQEIKITATAVRVPVMIGHGISMNIEFDKPYELREVVRVLSESAAVQLSEKGYTTSNEVEGKDEVYIGRIRRDPTVEHGLHLWLMSDNLRRGAALDIVEVAEKIYYHFLS